MLIEHIASCGINRVGISAGVLGGLGRSQVSDKGERKNLATATFRAASQRGTSRVEGIVQGQGADMAIKERQVAAGSN